MNSYYQAHKEELLAKARLRRANLSAEEKARLKERNKAYRARPEVAARMKAYSKEHQAERKLYYQNNKERIKERAKQWRLAHIDKVKAYYKTYHKANYVKRESLPHRRTCIICKEDFIGYNHSPGKWQSRKFCSNACLKQWRHEYSVELNRQIHPLVELQCAVCSKKFQTGKSHSVNPPKTCSEDCRKARYRYSRNLKARNRRREGTAKPHRRIAGRSVKGFNLREAYRRGEYIVGSYFREAACEQCKQVFPVLRKEHSRFCSRECGWAATGYTGIDGSKRRAARKAETNRASKILVGGQPHSWWNDKWEHLYKAIVAPCSLKNTTAIYKQFFYVRLNHIERVEQNKIRSRIEHGRKLRAAYSILRKQGLIQSPAERVREIGGASYTKGHRTSEYYKEKGILLKAAYQFARELNLI